MLDFVQIAEGRAFCLGVSSLLLFGLNQSILSQLTRRRLLLKIKTTQMASPLASSSFDRLSSFASSPTVPRDLLPTYGKIRELYSELQGQMALLGTKVEGAIHRGEQAMLSAFEARMLKMQDELEICRKNCMKQFRGMADADLAGTKVGRPMRRVQVCVQQKAKIKRMARVIEDLQSENRFLDSQLKKAQRENAELRQNVYGRITNSVEKMQSPPSESATTTSGEKFVEQFFSNLAQHQPADPLPECKRLLLETCAKYERAIASLHAQLARRPMASARTDLERLFCDCAEEVRRQILPQQKSHHIQPEAVQHILGSISPYGDEPTTNGNESFSGLKLKRAQKAKIMESFMTDDRLLCELFRLIFRCHSNDKTVPASIENSARASRNTIAPSMSTSTSPDVRIRRRRDVTPTSPADLSRQQQSSPSVRLFRRTKCFGQRKCSCIGTSSKPE